MNNRNIERVFNVAVHNLLTINGTMDYGRITETITRLANMIMDSETSEDTWWLESNGINLSDFIVGAYWHYAEWHGGQSSQGYAALSALGQVFSPNMSCMESGESYVYELLDTMATKQVIEDEI